MPEDKSAEAAKEAASRISGKLRNLENEINSTRSTPPDPALAVKFDEIQSELEALKSGTPGSAPPAHAEKHAEKNDDKKKK